MCFSFYIEYANDNSSFYLPCEYLMITFIFGYLLANFLSLGPMIPVFTAEILSPKANSYGWIIHWTSGLIVVFTFPVIK